MSSGSSRDGNMGTVCTLEDGGCNVVQLWCASKECHVKDEQALLHLLLWHYAV
jgi:hypothetical protein